MNALISTVNPVTMTSREIAELTGKEHFHVMRDLRKLQEQLGDMFGGAIQNWKMGVPAIDVFDQNYGTVKAYHASVWMAAYAVSINPQEAA